MHNTKNQYDVNMLKSRIKEMRKLRNETQQSLAEKMYIKRQTIINWEKEGNNSIPSVQNLIDLSKNLNCTIEYLLGSVDMPEFSPVTIVKHYSGINEDIIKRVQYDDEYLNFLNFFMHPKNSADIFNGITLHTFKKHFVDSHLEEIGGELKEDIIFYFDEYIAMHSFNEINKDTYKDFLIKKFPKEDVSLFVKIKGYIPIAVYQNFFPNKQFNYSKFINYLVEHTFEPLSHKPMFELLKFKLANKFIELFIKYLNED